MTSAVPQLTDTQIMGMLYIVEVRMVSKGTEEVTKQKILMVGNEASDIDRKVRWLFDVSKYSEFSIASTEKIRRKVHVLSTTVTQPEPSVGPLIERPDGTVPVPQGRMHSEKYDPNLYAVGVVTTILAKDQDHAMRKVGNALVAMGSTGESHAGARLSSDSTVSVEQIPKSSGYASPRDVSKEINTAHFVRG